MGNDSLRGKVALGELTFSQWTLRLMEVKRYWHAVLRDERLIERLLALKVTEITDYIAAQPSSS